MITLITGLPGSGKTLRTIFEVKAIAEKDGRDVYYDGINDLMLPWVQCEGAKWYECPTGAVIVIDECQRLFRPRANGSIVPEYVARLETHRHDGHDLYLITQHPMLVDSNVRRLVGRHVHIARRFGLQRATVLEFPSVREQPTSRQDDATRIEWSYPKEVYDYYKSAEVHTHKVRIPAKVLLLVALPFMIEGLIYWQWQKMHGRMTGETETAAAPGQTGAGVSGAGGQSGGAAPKPGYFEAQTPRVAGLAYTAPAYDEVTKPKQAPYPAGCVAQKSTGCRCYSQQGTRLDVPPEMCAQIVERGFFVAWQDPENVRALPQSQPVSVAPVPDRSEPAVPTIQDAGRWHGRQGVGMLDRVANDQPVLPRRPLAG